MTPDPAILRALETDGFAVVPNILARDIALGMRTLLQACIDDDLRRWEGKPGYIDQWMVHNLMLRGEPFLRVLENPVLHAYCTTMLTETCIVYAYTSSSMPPGGSNYSRRIHVDCPRFIPGYATNIGITLALDDFTEQNGATQFMPGSHLSADTPTEATFARDARTVYLRAGEAAFFHGRTFHRGGINRTDQPRHAITINVCRSYMRQRFDYPRLVPPELVDMLGPVGRRFLGFNVRVPTSLDEYYVSDDQRLYLPGQG